MGGAHVSKRECLSIITNQINVDVDESYLSIVYVICSSSLGPPTQSRRRRLMSLERFINLQFTPGLVTVRKVRTIAGLVQARSR